MLLALDTSTERLCLALAEGSHKILVHEEPGGALASRRLLPATRDLLERGGCSWEDLEAVAVTIGPGAFTGLRTACSAAQGIALGRGIPVLPLGSLDLVAMAAAVRQGQTPSLVPSVIRVAVDARMGQVYDGSYHWSGGAKDGLRALEAPAVREPQAVIAQWMQQRHQPSHPDPHHHEPQVPGSAPAKAQEIWVGSGLALMEADLLQQAQADGVILLPHEENRALALAQLTLQAWAAGQATDPALLVPLYVRDRVAQTTAERLGTAA